MRKVLAALALVSLGSAFVAADDAVVLPQGVLRLRFVPAYAMTDKEFDKDGTKVDTQAEGTMTVLSGAAEFGVVEPVTLGVKWAPGYLLMSDLKKLPEAMKNATMTGPMDLEIGAKVQLLGSQGFLKSDALRFALTPGVSVPLDKYDAKAEFEKASKNEKFRLGSSSQHYSLGVGVKADADYVINDMFFLNLHGQAFYYTPSKVLTFETVFNNAIAIQTNMGMGQTLEQATIAANVSDPLTETETVHGLEFGGEFEPHAKFSLSKTTNISLGVPVAFNMDLADTMTYNKVETKGEESYSLGVAPSLSFFTLLGPLPVEAQVQYGLPLMGKNSTATSTLSLQLKLFAKFY